MTGQGGGLPFPKHLTPTMSNELCLGRGFPMLNHISSSETSEMESLETSETEMLLCGCDGGRCSASDPTTTCCEQPWSIAVSSAGHVARSTHCVLAAIATFHNPLSSWGSPLGLSSVRDSDQRGFADWHDIVRGT